MSPLDQIVALQLQLSAILADMQTYPSRYDEPTQRIAASSAVKYTLQQLICVLPPALQSSVQTILDQHDTLWGLFQTPPPQEPTVLITLQEVIV